MIGPITDSCALFVAGFCRTPFFGLNPFGVLEKIPLFFGG